MNLAHLNLMPRTEEFLKAKGLWSLLGDLLDNSKFESDCFTYISELETLLYPPDCNWAKLAFSSNDSIQEHPLTYREKMYNAINARKKKARRFKYKK